MEGNDFCFSETVWTCSLLSGYEFNCCQTQRDVLLSRKRIRNSDLQPPNSHIAKQFKGGPLTKPKKKSSWSLRIPVHQECL